MSSEDVHPGHSLCLIMRHTLGDITQLQEENDTEEGEVQKELIKFIVSLLGVVNESLKASPELMPQCQMSVVDSPSARWEDHEEIRVVIFDPDAYSWGPNRLGVHLDGSLGYIHYTDVGGPRHIHKLLVDTTGQWVDLDSANNTQKLTTYAQGFLGGLCQKVRLLQRKVDEELARKETIQGHKDRLRLIRAQLREAARRNQVL